MAEDRDDIDIDYCFVRLTAEQLAKTIIGDVRSTPTPDQVAHAQDILDHTGTLYRLVAGFQLKEWQHK